MDMNRLLDALRHVESRGNRFAVSPKGARGPYQFMPKTAKEFGLYGDDVFDEQKSRTAAHKKLGGLINRYGVERGIAAYNMGEGNLEKVGGDYSKFPETAKYVPSVLAAYKGSQGDLRNAGFKGYQQRPQATIDNYPALLERPIPEKQVETRTMPVIDFSKQKKDIQHSKLMAQVLAGAFDSYDPNAQISGRAIPLNPITALAKALQTGFGAYEGARAQAKESDMEAQQRAAMQELVKSGKPITAQDLFNSGNLEPEKLAEALVKTNTVKPEYINTADGVFEVSPGAEPKQIMANGKPLKRSIDNPELQGLITAMKQGSMAREGIDKNMRPFVAQNRDYSPGAFPRLDQSTTLMPVPGSPPQQGMTRVDPSSEEAKAVMRQMQESGADTIQIEPQQPQPAAIDQIEAAKEAAKNAVNLPYDIQKQQQVGDIKAQQDVALAQEKAAIENQQKIEQASQKKETAGKNIIDVLNTKINGKTVDELIDESTGSGIGAAADASAAFFGKSTKGSVAADSLKTLQGWLVSNIPRMEGPQSDFDVQNYQQMAGKIADPNTPPDRKKAALASLKALVKKYETNPAEQTEIDPKKAELEQLRKELMQ